MLPARLADPQIQNSTRERTGCISSLATHAGPDAVLLPSRLVSLPKLVRDVDNRVRGGISSWTADNELVCESI